MAVPLFDTETPLAPVRDEILERIGDVVRSGRFVLGPEVDRVRAGVRRLPGGRHVIGVANGTDALAIALRSLGVKPGDDVVVPSLTFYASAEAIADIGARPVFCDVDPRHPQRHRGDRPGGDDPGTTAIMAVDLFGVPAPSRRAASARSGAGARGRRAGGRGHLDGRRAGALGDAATFSFYPSKNLPCFGDGGAIATDDDEVAEMARAAALPRLARQGDVRAGRLQLAPGRDPGRRPAGAAAPTWTSGPTAAAPALEAYLAAGLGDHVDGPRAAGGRRPAWHLYVVTHPGPTRCWRRSTRPACRRAATTGCRCHRQPAMAPFLDGAAGAAGHRRARARQHRAADQPGARRRAGARGRGRARRRGLSRRDRVPMRVWVDLTNSPHVLVMRPVIEQLRADGDEVAGDRARLRADARRCATASGSTTRRSATTAAPGWPARRGGWPRARWR